MCERFFPLIFTVPIASVGAQLIPAEIASDRELLPAAVSFMLFLVIFAWKIKAGA